MVSADYGKRQKLTPIPLNRLQFAHMSNIASGDRANLGGKQRDDSHRFTSQGHKFNLVAETTLMNVDNRTDIPCFHFLFR